LEYHFGPFRLDPAKRRLWRDDQLEPLTPKAFDTLLVLVERAGKVVEKDEILKAVWPDTFVEEATLAQNISTLRKVLGDTSEAPTYIATVPRRGYRFLESVAPVLDHQHDLTGRVSIPTAAQVNREATTASASLWKHLGLTLSAVITLGIIAGGIRALRTASQPGTAIVFTISPPEGTSFSTSGSFMGLSPDGRNVAFLASGPDGSSSLWLRSLDSPVPHRMAGTNGASQPFWSADSHFLAFFADGKLKKVGAAGGPTQTICAVPIGSQPLAGTWNRRDDILFSSLRQGILRVSANGGIATPAIPQDPEDDHVSWPQFLPDGRHFLYVVSSMRPDRSGIYASALDSTDRTRVAAPRSYAMYAPPGQLLYLQGDTLVAQPFDSVRLQVTGSPVPVADHIAFNAGSGRAAFSVADNGLLAYRTVGDTELTWFDRSGKSLGRLGRVGGYLHFSVSPDSTRVAAARLDPNTGTSDIWIVNADGSNERRLTFDPSWETSPVWSRDMAHIVFASNRKGRWEIYKKPSSGDGEEQPLRLSETSVFPEDWSASGNVLFRRWDPNEKTKGDFWLVAPGGDASRGRLPDLEFDEKSGRVSPDGRWLAYEGWESAWSVYVRPLQSPGSRQQVSPAGSTEPRWRGDGNELFFLSPDLSVMATDVQPGQTFRAGPARRLFQTQAVAPSGLAGQAYDVTSDGQRFLVKVPASVSPITVVVNWTSLHSKPTLAASLASALTAIEGLFR
jgi:eukaryotic-like serine/threonine-protein kinase